MSYFRHRFVVIGILIQAGITYAQVGTISGPANQLLFCTATIPAPTQLRPEGYTELLGDIIITCTGGPIFFNGWATPTVNLVVYTTPAVPITSRLVKTTNSQYANRLSEAILTIDEPGSGLTTGATGNYGPNAPQVFCPNSPNQCAAYAEPDGSGNYLVATSAPSPGAANAANVYAGFVGDFGANSVVFYNVPVLPPAYQGVKRVFRISNLRVPVFGQNLASNGQVAIILSASPSTVLPVPGFGLIAGTVHNPTSSSVNTAPPGFLPFPACLPAIAAQVTFTEGFAHSFKTRVVPLTNASWASTAQNTGSPGQNVPGSLYGGFGANSESGFVFPGFSNVVNGVTYTAGLMEFGTRLKAIFSNIPPGASIYVSANNNPSYPIPGGTGTSPYAVMVSQESVNDGTVLGPPAGSTTACDGTLVNLLTPDSAGIVAATWEVVNADPSSIDSFTFSVYMGFDGDAQQITAPGISLSLAPEPGGGSFGPSDLQITTPVPRFGFLFNFKPASTAFLYAIGGLNPPGQTVSVTPGNVPMTVSPVITTPQGGNWLSASLTGGKLTVSVDPAGLTASATPYSGSIRLSPPNSLGLFVPVTLLVAPLSCDVNGNGNTDVSDVQLIVNQALGTASATDDLDHDGMVSVTDVQRVINGALGLGCSMN